MKLLILISLLNFLGGEEGEVLSADWVHGGLYATPVGADSIEDDSVAVDQIVDEIDIYPQPAHDVLFVSLAYSFGEQVRIELYDVLGLKVYKEVLTGPRTAIDVSGLSQGVYFLAVKAEGARRSVIRRVIIY